MLAKTCPQCRVEFEKPYSESVRNFLNRHVYCSKKCYTLSMKGKDFFVGKRSKTSWNKGVSGPTGEDNPRWTRLGKKCKTCGGDFVVKKYRNGSAKYCSPKCKTDDNLGLTTENESVRKSKAYRLWRTAVFERDCYSCVECGARSGNGHTLVLNADHIKPFALFPELRLDVSNGRTLCTSCHKKTETFGRVGLFRNLVAAAQEA